MSDIYIEGFPERIEENLQKILQMLTLKDIPEYKNKIELRSDSTCPAFRARTLRATRARELGLAVRNVPRDASFSETDLTVRDSRRETRRPGTNNPRNLRSL